MAEGIRIRATHAARGLDVDVTVPVGATLAVVGPNGAGKSSLLQLVSGDLVPDAGHVTVDGRLLTGPGVHVPPHRRPTGYVEQRPLLFPHLTVADNVAFGLRSRRTPKSEITSRVSEMLDVVRLPEFAQRRPAQLSGGQQQRVALARALVNRPAALLLDEPLGALDLKLRQSMQLELKRIQRELRSTFVFVTHDQEEALTMSDRIAVMTQGRVDQIGTPTDIYHHPATVFVAGFIGTANLLPVEVSGQDGDVVTVTSRTGASYPVPGSGRSHRGGESVTLMVRPERLSVREPGTGGIEAILTSVVFQGPVLRCQATTSTGTDLVAHVGVGELPPGVAPGGQVCLAWGQSAGYLVPETISADQAGVTTAEDVTDVADDTGEKTEQSGEQG